MAHCVIEGRFFVQHSACHMTGISGAFLAFVMSLLFSSTVAFMWVRTAPSYSLWGTFFTIYLFIIIAALFHGYHHLSFTSANTKKYVSN